MNIFLRVVLFFVFLFFGVFIGEFILQYLYNLLPNSGGASWFGTMGSLSLLFGAIFAFYFFLPLLITALFNKAKYYLLIVNIILLLPVLWLFYPDWWFNGTLIVLSVIGWFVGEGINKVITNFKLRITN